MDNEMMELAKKYAEYLGPEGVKSLLKHVEKTREPGYHKRNIAKTTETAKINSFLEKFREFLLFSEEYISTNLTLIIDDHMNYRNNKEEPRRLTIEEIKYSLEIKKLKDDFPKILRTSLLISLCSYIEDIVKNKGIENHKSNHKFEQKSQMGIFESSKIILKDEIGIKDIESLNWSYFIDLFKIRNDLAHNGGKINRSRHVNLETYKISKDENQYLIISKESMETIFIESEKFISNFSTLVIMDL